ATEQPRTTATCPLTQPQRSEPDERPFAAVSSFSARSACAKRESRALNDETQGREHAAAKRRPLNTAKNSAELDQGHLRRADDLGDGLLHLGGDVLVDAKDDRGTLLVDVLAELGGLDIDLGLAELGADLAQGARAVVV